LAAAIGRAQIVDFKQCFGVGTHTASSPR
jgi:hypothetical protein